MNGRFRNSNHQEVAHLCGKVGVGGPQPFDIFYTYIYNVLYARWTRVQVVLDLLSSGKRYIDSFTSQLITWIQ